MGLLNQREHDRLGNHVNQCLSGDVEIRVDEQFLPPVSRKSPESTKTLTDDLDFLRFFLG